LTQWLSGPIRRSTRSAARRSSAVAHGATTATQRSGRFEQGNVAYRVSFWKGAGMSATVGTIRASGRYVCTLCKNSLYRRSLPVSIVAGTIVLPVSVFSGETSNFMIALLTAEEDGGSNIRTTTQSSFRVHPAPKHTKTKPMISATQCTPAAIARKLTLVLITSFRICSPGSNNRFRSCRHT